MEEQAGELLEWYDRFRRILPWREDPTPYHIWLSEIMLQQTRVEAGRACYLRFVETLPDIASLAAAEEDVYLKLWEGLGYYSRVRNMHRAAVQVMEEYGGKMPQTAQELEKLPGIGPYSAAAIASIAFGQPVAAIDGNLLRIFARLTEYGGDIKRSSARAAAQEYYMQRMPAARPGDFNQALMDLGAGICVPNGEPACDACPWETYCASRRRGTSSLYPVMPDKKPRRKEERTVLLLCCEGRILLRRRPAKGLLAGLYEFPNTEGHLDAREATMFAASLGLPGLVFGTEPVRLPAARHIFTHVEWDMTGYRIDLPGGKAGGQETEMCGETGNAGGPKTGTNRPSGKDGPRDAAGYGALVWATRGELMTKYSIPSAFEAFRKEALRAGECGFSQSQSAETLEKALCAGKCSLHPHPADPASRAEIICDMSVPHGS